jgi:hypothetical protein
LEELQLHHHPKTKSGFSLSLSLSLSLSQAAPSSTPKDHKVRKKKLVKKIRSHILNSFYKAPTQDINSRE